VGIRGDEFFVGVHGAARFGEGKDGMSKLLERRT
jgi:hypothetical protein